MKHDQEHDLIEKYLANPNEKDLSEIFKLNANLINSIYLKWFKRSECPKEDLIQEGNIGLFLAIQKYKPKYRRAFIGYKCLWIRKKMYDFRRKFFKHPFETLGGNLDIIAPATRSQKMREAIFELDNCVNSGKISKQEAKSMMDRLLYR